MAIQQRLSRKGLLLMVLLTLLILLGPLSPPRPAHAWCEPLLCPWDPPMHWDCAANACVCDCPVNPWDDPSTWTCGPCV
jgi:hypothetical protein